MVKGAVDMDGKRFAMRGPMRVTDPSRTPIRGDLADIRLAGRYFVPHYAVPQHRRIGAGGAALMGATRLDADRLAQLAPGETFAVLDVAGGWAWGQAGGEHGLVGYVALEALA
jgi:hypothetical protein